MVTLDFIVLLFCPDSCSCGKFFPFCMVSQCIQCFALFNQKSWSSGKWRETKTAVKDSLRQTSNGLPGKMITWIV